MIRVKGWFKRGYLPHNDSDCTYQFITFRLFDSVPQEVIDNWKQDLEGNKDNQELDVKIKLEKMVHKYEDMGYGCCILKNIKAYDIVKNTLLFYDMKKYQLIEWVIMPNHVHVLIRVNEGFSISSILHSWKSFSANEINRVLHRKGQVWMRSYYDRFIRNEEHYDNVIRYIRGNEEKRCL